MGWLRSHLGRRIAEWRDGTWPPPAGVARARNAAADWGAGWEHGCGHDDCQGEHPGPELLPDGRPRVITSRSDHSPQIGLNISYGGTNEREPE